MWIDETVWPKWVFKRSFRREEDGGFHSFALAWSDETPSTSLNGHGRCRWQIDRYNVSYVVHQSARVFRDENVHQYYYLKDIFKINGNNNSRYWIFSRSAASVRIFVLSRFRRGRPRKIQLQQVGVAWLMIPTQLVCIVLILMIFYVEMLSLRPRFYKINFRLMVADIPSTEQLVTWQLII